MAVMSNQDYCTFAALQAAKLPLFFKEALPISTCCAALPMLCHTPLQALEAIKLLSGVGEPLSRRLLAIDCAAGRFHSVKLRAK